MHAHPYQQMVRYKQWADRGLHEIIAGNFERLDEQDAAILVRILDHIHVVDRIFQHHLQGRSHEFHAPRSEKMPDLRRLIDDARVVDDWYASYVGKLSTADLDEPIDFSFTNGAPARMTRGEMLMHVCLHGTYHRGNAGIFLQKNGIKPNDDRMTDFLDASPIALAV